MIDPQIRPRRTHLSNIVFGLMGGNEDNDLWLFRERDSDGTKLRSTWVPNDEQRKAIAEGQNIELIVWGESHPPVSLLLCNYPLGKPPEERS